MKFLRVHPSTQKNRLLHLVSPPTKNAQGLVSLFIFWGSIFHTWEYFSSLPASNRRFPALRPRTEEALQMVRSPIPVSLSLWPYIPADSCIRGQAWEKMQFGACDVHFVSNLTGPWSTQIICSNIWVCLGWGGGLFLDKIHNIGLVE